jgi:hypothetical protein
VSDGNGLGSSASTAMIPAFECGRSGGGAFRFGEPT